MSSKYVAAAVPCGHRNVRARFLPGSGNAQASTQAVKKLQVPSGSFDSFAAAVAGLPGKGVNLEWETQDLSTTHPFITASYQLMVQHLPLEVLQELRDWLFNPAAPAALHICGLPLDADIPKTPTARKGIGKDRDVVARLPVAEAVVLGAAAVMGTPVMAASIAKGNRGGLVSDLVGVEAVQYTHKVPMKPHVELLLLGRMRPDALLFYGVRQDPAGECRTTIADNRAILAALDPNEVKLLRENQVHFVKPDGSSMAGWTVVEGSEEQPLVSLFDPVVVKPFKIAGPNEEVTAAYNKALEAADRVAEKVAVQPGELLLVNQWRANKGRTAHQLAGTGEDWWLLKTYIKHHTWPQPGTPTPTPLAWPQLVIPGL